ncbi:MAG: MarR family transcriptional regulator, partial [Comamonas sp.]
MNTPKGCTNLKLRQLTRLVTRHYDHYTAAAGLKTTQYSLLSHV